jgi:membrane fusion protein (multidrug efflux system)
MLVVTAVLLLAGLGYGLYWNAYLRHHENTDDAYVAGNVVQVTPQVGGTVIAINADDTELVKSGAVLVELDKSDANVALQQAQAQLGQAVREVRTLYVNNGTLAANIATRTSEVARARDDLARRQQLAGSGAVSKEDIAHAASALRSAESALQSAREQLASNRVLTDRTSVEKHPNVQRAAALVQNAYLNYARTSLPAPIGGYVAKRSVQVGQRIAAGTPLMSIVALDSLWVDANFKEVQIARMRVGQPVLLHSDLYGSDVVYHGRIAGLAAGTGSAFALLPSQNASGNWIKIVQRLPVRISLDAAELAKRPLRIGVSMQAEVDVAASDGTSLTTGAPARTAPAYQTTVFDSAGKEAEALIARIIADNAGQPR